MKLFQINKTIIPLLILISIAYLIFKPTFKLALYGDDWLTIYRYKYHLGSWSNSEFNFLTYFLTPYGPQDVLTGLIWQTFNTNSVPYYFTSLILRSIASFMLYQVSKYFTRNSFISIICAILFSVTPIGIEATDWVFNFPSFIALSFLALFFISFFTSIFKSSYFHTILAGLFYFIAFLIAPIRMHGLPFFVIVIELFNIIINKKLSNIKLVVFRQLLMIFSLYLVSSLGSSLGESPINIIKQGLLIAQNLISQGNYTFLLTPFIIIGRYIISETSSTPLKTIFNQNLFRYTLVLYSVIFLPIFLIFKKTITKSPKILIPYLFSIFIWIFLVWRINKTVFPLPHNTEVFGAALLGGYFSISIFFYLLSLNKKLKLLIFANLSWLYLSILFPYIRSPHELFSSSHRYLIVSFFTFPLLLSFIFSSLNDKFSRTLLILFISYLFISYSLESHRFFSNQIPIRGIDISNNIWASLPRHDFLKTQNGPFIYYFEGESSRLYHDITFGFPPHMGLDYDIKEGNKIPIAMDTWAHVVDAVKTGNILSAHGYPQNPIAINRIYAFRLKNNKLIDITQYKRDELQFILDNNL